MTRDLWVMSSTEVPGYFHGVPLGRENGRHSSLDNISTTDDEAR